MLPVLPRLWRPLGIAYRAGPVERATQHVLDVLWQQKQVSREAQPALRGPRRLPSLRLRRPR